MNETVTKRFLLYFRLMLLVWILIVNAILHVVGFAYSWLIFLSNIMLFTMEGDIKDRFLSVELGGLVGMVLTVLAMLAIAALTPVLGGLLGLLLPLAVVLSLGLALLLEARIPLKSEFRTFFLSPMMVPIASIILIWQVLFHYNGVINEFLQVFGADKIDWLKSDYCMVVIVVLFLWKNLGYNMILFMAALSNIPRELLEVAEVEGASAAYQFFHIKLRYLSPTVLFVTILSIINSFKVFREIYLLTGNYPYDGLYMMQHFMNNMFNSADYQRLSAAAVLLAIVIVILIALLFFVENIFGKDVEG